MQTVQVMSSPAVALSSQGAVAAGSRLAVQRSAAPVAVRRHVGVRASAEASEAPVTRRVAVGALAALLVAGSTGAAQAVINENTGGRTLNPINKAQQQSDESKKQLGDKIAQAPGNSPANAPTRGANISFSDQKANIAAATKRAASTVKSGRF